eukprot:TRINITY_DN1824_c4_g1_i1.p1 TRINITY_DN1824_c4_g1~~TRINITY_DN1824_c4_g1_i1.p1  ORF type:complete len:150 (+),score=36.25 TRINITY_DN1824_c4_g1_i1:647-1096(+)
MPRQLQRRSQMLLQPDNHRVCVHSAASVITPPADAHCCQFMPPQPRYTMRSGRSGAAPAAATAHPQTAPTRMHARAPVTKRRSGSRSSRAAASGAATGPYEMVQLQPVFTGGGGGGAAAGPFRNGGGAGTGPYEMVQLQPVFTGVTAAT